MTERDKKQPTSRSLGAKPARPDVAPMPAGGDGIRAPLDVKSVSGYWQGDWALGDDMAVVEFTNGMRIETRDPVIKALVTDILHHRCQIDYALRHFEGWCECTAMADCDDRGVTILRECEHYVTKQWWLDTLAKQARTTAVQPADSAADATAPQPAGLLKTEGET